MGCSQSNDDECFDFSCLDSTYSTKEDFRAPWSATFETGIKWNEDGLTSVYCRFKNKGIFQKDGNLFLPLNNASYSVQLNINDNKQHFRLLTDEFLLYRTGSIINSAFVGDLKFQTLCKTRSPVKYSETIMDSLVPYFYHHVFSSVVGSSKSMARYQPKANISFSETQHVINPLADRPNRHSSH